MGNKSANIFINHTRNDKKRPMAMACGPIFIDGQIQWVGERVANNKL